MMEEASKIKAAINAAIESEINTIMLAKTQAVDTLANS
jgi:hypothetical protein